VYWMVSYFLNFGTQAQDFTERLYAKHVIRETHEVGITLTVY
jgi:hypothetical protein